MPWNAKFYVTLWCVHITTYLLPRACWKLLVRGPCALLAWVRRRVLPFRAPDDQPKSVPEDHIDVVSHGEDRTTVRRFGLEHGTRYPSPLYNAHVSTVLANFRPSRRNVYERFVVDAKDGNPVCVDWLRPADGTAPRGVLAVFPGLGSYSQTSYVQSIARYSAQNGFHCYIVNARGMGNTPLTKPQLTSAAFTDDIHAVMETCCHPAAIRERTGAELPVVAVGFSIGGAMLIKYLGEVGKRSGQTPVVGAVAVSTPYDLAASASMMMSTIGRLLYQASMMSALMKYVKKHEAVFKQGVPGLEHLPGTDPFRYAQKHFRVVQDFDRHVVAPHFGYEDEKAYYKDGSAMTWLPFVKVPIVCVASADDPVSGDAPSREFWTQLTQQNKQVVIVTTPCGGHLGFLSAPADEAACAPSFMEVFPVQCLCAFLQPRTVG